MKHKQKYYKKENLKVKKSGLQEIVGPRSELEPYVGETLECMVFVTNSLGYLGDKRLITEIRIPKTKLYIKHLWVKSVNCPIDQVPHGYQKIKLKVIQYTDQRSGDTKYGVKIADPKIKSQRNPETQKMVIPEWKREMLENEALKSANKKPETKSPFKKIRIVRKK